jgi:hypothetical protein
MSHGNTGGGENTSSRFCGNIYLTVAASTTLLQYIDSAKLIWLPHTASRAPSCRTLFIYQSISVGTCTTMFVFFQGQLPTQWRTSWLTNSDRKRRTCDRRGLDPWFPLLASFLQGSKNIQNVFPHRQFESAKNVNNSLYSSKLHVPPVVRGGVLKKLSLSVSAKLSWLRFGLASAGYRGLVVHDRPVYTAG